MKILWIAPRWPNPPNDGAKQATLELLRPLSQRAELQITLLALPLESESVGKNGAPELPELHVKGIRLFERRPAGLPPALRFLLRPLVPVTFASFLEPMVAKGVRATVDSQPWDAIVFDGFHSALPFLRLRNNVPDFHFQAREGHLPAIYYRAHNVEWRLWEQLAEESLFPMRQAIAFQAAIVRRLENSLARASTAVLPVSDSDEAIFRADNRSTPFHVAHIGQEFPDSPPERNFHSGPLRLGFLGRLDWKPNRQGLEWLLREVWPAARKELPGLRLLIAGSGDAKWLANWKRSENSSGVEFLGRVEKVGDFYQSVDLSLAPIFLGSGTRVKVIEAARYACPVLGTALGLEGCDLRDDKSCLSAESAKEWIETLATARRERLQEIGANAFREMREGFNSPAIAAAVAELFQRNCAKRA
jgi:polysaccharide biosynthesis protein PslH